MNLETKYASGKNTIRYKKNSGYYLHRDYFDDLRDFQDTRESNGDYSINTVNPPCRTARGMDHGSPMTATISLTISGVSKRAFLT